MAVEVEYDAPAWCFLPAVRKTVDTTRNHQWELKQVIRNLAQTASGSEAVFCYLRAPIGGSAIGFIW